jgi:dienelactone hydrolase
MRKSLPRNTLMLFALLGIISASFCASAQEIIHFPTVNSESGGGGEDVEAALSRPADAAQGSKLPAVILVHSAWGWAEEGVTGKYAAALTKAGFITLEPHLFANSKGIKAGGPAAYLPHAFAALKYLASRPDVDPQRIALAGYSFGGLVSLVSATSWANTKYGSSGTRFAAFAPFYPICWVFAANATGQRRSPVPTDAWAHWTGAPVRIYAGAIDDYDDRDPNACQNAVNSIPASEQKSFSVRVFPDATHGWDQTRSDNFFEKLACKGRGCDNHNRQNPEATKQSIGDLIEFLTKSMSK